MKIINSIKIESEKLAVPENYHNGHHLPEKFALPDNILMFFGRWGVSHPQSHGRYQLVIPFSSVIYLVEQSRYELDTGTCLLLSPWEKHNHLPGSENVLCERLLITFSLPSPQSYLPAGHQAVLSTRAEEYTLELLKYYAAKNVPEMSWTLMKLLNELSGIAPSIPGKKLSDITSNTLELITKNIGNAIDIQLLADKLKLSASHLRSIFRRDMGMGIGKYIAEQRLQMACVQLKKPEISIQEIADSCGFASICAFCHFFKNKTGLAPGTFRKTENDNYSERQ